MTVMLASVTTPRVRIGARANVERAWDFDVPAIERALEQLELDDALVLGTTRGRTAGGRHFYRLADTNTGREHEIRVDAYASVRRASTVLWHELAHAHQAEQFPTPAKWWRAYERAGGSRGQGYAQNRYEVEARSWQRKARLIPLVVAR